MKSLLLCWAISLVFFVSLQQEAAAQAPLWIARYDSIGPGEAAAMAAAGPGALYVLGTAQDTEPGFLLLKYSTEGNQEWTRRFAWPKIYGFRGAAAALAVDDSGFVYVAGYDEIRGNDYGYVTLKYAPDGALLWARELWRDGTNREARAMAVDGDGNVYVSGYSRGNLLTVSYDRTGNLRWTAEEAGVGASSDSKWARVRLDNKGYVVVLGVLVTGGHYARPLRELAAARYTPEGDRLWVRRLDNTNYHTGDARLSGGLGVDGQRNVYVTHTNPDFDVEIVKYDEDGFELRRRSFDLGGWEDDVVDASVTADGTVYVSSFSNFDLTTSKVRADGQLAWTRSYRGGKPAVGRLHRPKSLVVDPGGSSCTAGASDSAAGTDYLTVCYSPDGDLLLSDRYDDGFWDSPAAVSIGDRGDVYVTGSTADVTMRTITTLKYASIVTASLTRPDVPNASLSLTLIGPNPVESRVVLSLVMPETQYATVTVFDMLGRAVSQVHDGLISGGAPFEVSFDASRLPAGAYLCVARGPSGTVSRMLHVVR